MTPFRRRPTLEFIYRGAAVKRFHTARTVKEQTDGAHSFGVAWWCYLLTDGAASRELLLEALAHDLAEQVTGDLSAVVKRTNGLSEKLDALEDDARRDVGLKFELSPKEQQILRLADKLDGMMFAVAERRLGNRDAERWYERWRTWIKDEALPAEFLEWVTLVDMLMTEAVL